MIGSLRLWKCVGKCFWGLSERRQARMPVLLDAPEPESVELESKSEVGGLLWRGPSRLRGKQAPPLRGKPILVDRVAGAAMMHGLEMRPKARAT